LPVDAGKFALTKQPGDRNVDPVIALPFPVVSQSYPMKKIRLKKYEQAVAILPGCKGLDRSVLYDNLKTLGYCWDIGDRKWLVR
jgi:hypothetical protein